VHACSYESKLNVLHDDYFSGVLKKRKNGNTGVQLPYEAGELKNAVGLRLAGGN